MPVEGDTGAADPGAPFRGILRLPEGDAVRAVLALRDGSLVVEVGGEEVGSWPLRACRAVRDGPGFLLTIDGETARFDPAETDRFARMAAERFEGSTLADRVSLMRGAPPERATGRHARPERDPLVSRPTASGAADRGGAVDRGRVARWVGFVGSAVVAGVVAAALGLGPAGEPPPTVGDGSSPPTTEVPDPDDGVFSLVPEAFALRWNEVADRLGVDLRLVGVSGSGGFERRLSDRVLLQATAGDDGTVDAFVLTVDPAGSGEENTASLASWGLAVAVASPGLDADGRRAVLADLGFDVDEPLVAGLDGETVRDGVRYTMRYVEGFRTVLFAVEGA